MQLYPGRFMLELDTWKTPATNYPRKAAGTARIATTTYKAGFYNMYGVRAADGEQYQHFEAVNPLKVTQLKIGGKTWMVDDPPHHYGTIEAAQTYTGHVLCAGLGLGLIVHALRDNPAVTKVTVVERCKDVIDLVWPHLAPNGRPEGGPLLTVWRGDWWDVRPDVLADLVGPVDGVFFDLLVGNGRELIGEAIYATKDARRRWPGVPTRVFGMNSDVIGEMLDAREEADAARILDHGRLTPRPRPLDSDEECGSVGRTDSRREGVRWPAPRNRRSRSTRRAMRSSS